ncbi:unnamed protein product [Blepharisma stoltei]|uniref:protein-serine/threonine phosphatase n=1 Tax=Blepharisma stoltei TaxID=1481888 RepID=A0AAU9KP84_9CILI|nr:unnamed protein product [Blepharisma stoltei]
MLQQCTSKDLFSGFHNESDDEILEIQQANLNITNPELLRPDSDLTHSQLHLFFSHILSPNFVFTKIWLSKFNLISNRNYAALSTNKALFKEFKAIIFIITQDLYPIVNKDPDTASIILQIFSELYYRRSCIFYQEIIDEFRINVHMNRVEGLVKNSKTIAFSLRREEREKKKNDKKKRKEGLKRERSGEMHNLEELFIRKQQKINEFEEDIKKNSWGFDCGLGEVEEWFEESEEMEEEGEILEEISSFQEIATIEEENKNHLFAAEYTVPESDKENVIPTLPIQIPSSRTNTENKKKDPRIIPFLHTKGIDFLINTESIRGQLEKFIVILDLDNTLVSAHEGNELKQLQTKCQYIYEQVIVDKLALAIIRRPGLDNFLKEISKFCELYLYTNAIRPYAEKVLQLIDPDGKYFGRRIIACEANYSVTSQKSIEEISRRLDVKVNPEMVIIIDDQQLIWKNSEFCVPVIPFFPLTVPSKLTFVYSSELANHRISDHMKYICEPPAISNLFSIGQALKAAYANFLKNGSQRTAIYEFTEHRKSILKGFELSFKKYSEKLGKDGYTYKKLQVYQHLAAALGAEVSEKGLEIVENKEGLHELSSSWLINCYMHIEAMPNY